MWIQGSPQGRTLALWGAEGGAIRSLLRQRGWDGWTRTSECGSQSPVPYHLATPQYGGEARAGADAPALSHKYGVDNGARTHDTRNHNPVLCQLSYIHRMQFKGSPRSRPLASWGKERQRSERAFALARKRGIRSLSRRFGTPEGIRTPDLLLRRQLLYPPELQAHITRFVGTMKPAHYGVPARPSAGPVGKGEAAERAFARKRGMRSLSRRWSG